MPLFTRHPLALQTAFSDLARRAMEQPVLLAGTPGSVVFGNSNSFLNT